MLFVKVVQPGSCASVQPIGETEIWFSIQVLLFVTAWGMFACAFMNCTACIALSNHSVTTVLKQQIASQHANAYQSTLCTAAMPVKHDAT